MKIYISIVVAGLALGGCKAKGTEGSGSAAGGVGGGGNVASCTMAAEGVCREYSEANLAAGTDSLAKLCTTLDIKAKWAMTACASTDAVGTCTSPEFKDTYYKSYPGPADLIEKGCTAGVPAGKYEKK